MVQIILCNRRKNCSSKIIWTRLIAALSVVDEYSISALGDTRETSQNKSTCPMTDSYGVAIKLSKLNFNENFQMKRLTRRETLHREPAGSAQPSKVAGLSTKAGKTSEPVCQTRRSTLESGVDAQRNVPSGGARR